MSMTRDSPLGDGHKRWVDHHLLGPQASYPYKEILAVFLLQLNGFCQLNLERPVLYR